MSKPQFTHDHRPCACDRKHNPARPVQIGDHTIWAGGGMHLSPDDLNGFDHRIDLRAERLPGDFDFGHHEDGNIYLPIVDFGTVAEEDWGAWKMILDVTHQQMVAGIKKVVFCAGGHGRTGLFLASLLAMVEPDIDDPVAEIRNRYCSNAVETADQHAQVMRMLEETRAALAATS